MDLAPLSRAEEVHALLLQHRNRAAEHALAVCELAWEVHEHAYWREIRDPEGKFYTTEDAYFEAILDVQSMRTAARRIAIGRSIASLPDEMRESVTTALARIGVTKANVLVPLMDLEDTDSDEILQWCTIAEHSTVEDLQGEVSKAIGAKPRGLSPAGQRERNVLLNLMPDLESRELCTLWMQVEARVVGSANPVAIFIAGMQENLSEWGKGKS